MFNRNSMLKDINVISKFISLLFVIFAIIILKEKTILVIIGMVFLYLEKYKFLSIITAIITGFGLFFDIDFLVKLFLILTYLDLFRKIVDFNEYRNILEKLFYRSSSKVLYFFLKSYYYLKSFKVNFIELVNLIKGYGFKMNFKLLKFSMTQALSKSSIYVNKIMLNYKYRFYGMYQSRTYYDEDKLDSYDFKYILMHVIVFLIMYTYWR